MKLQNSYLLDAQRGLDILATDLSEHAKDCSITLQDRVGRALGKVSALVKIIQKEQIKIGREFAKRDAAGNVVTKEDGNLDLDKSKLDEFSSARETLLDGETELDDRIKPFSLKELQKDGCKKVAIWSALLAGPLLIDDVEE